MITEEEKLIIEEANSKLVLKRIFEDLSSSMIEYYDLNYLTKKELKHDIQEAWMLTMIKAREIDEKVIKEDCLNKRNEILKNNQNPNSESSDPADQDKITALEKEIKDLNETIELLKNQIRYTEKELNELNEKGEMKNLFYSEEQVGRIMWDYEKKIELMKNNNAAPEKSENNPRGAGRKPKITKKQIAMIQMLRAQGKKLQEIQTETGISYGNIQKYCKLITDNKKRAGL